MFFRALFKGTVSQEGYVFELNLYTSCLCAQGLEFLRMAYCCAIYHKRFRFSSLEIPLNHYQNRTFRAL
jgi:hypothetical protein